MSEEPTKTDNTEQAASEEEKTAFAETEETTTTEEKSEETTEEKSEETTEEKTEEKSEEKTEEEAEETVDASTLVNSVLDEYEMPEGMTASEEGKQRLTSIVEKHKLSKEAVLDIVDNYAKQRSDALAAMKTDAETFMTAERTAAEALPKDVMSAARKVVGKLGSETLKQRFSDANFLYGNDAHLIQLLAKLSKAVDGGFVDGEPGGEPASADAKNLYPNSKMN